MKFIYLIVFTLVTSINAQTMSIFIKATNSGWYPEFLKPVVKNITMDSTNKRILDIGTGPGTLPKMLNATNSNLEIIGIDIDSSMIKEAQKIPLSNNVSFQHQKINSALEFPSNQFDVVSFCSVLFLLDSEVRNNLLSEALRVVKPNGKIIVLTPTGIKPIYSSFIEVWRYPFSSNNFTFIIWKIATSRSGRKWKKQKWLEEYSKIKKLNYEWNLTFNNNASIEIITKSFNN